MKKEISFKIFSDVGMGELFMSRLFDFQGRILDGVFELPNRKEIKEMMIKVIFEGLEPAFQSLRSLRFEWLNDSIPERKKRKDIMDVYGYLTVAFKDRFQKVADLMGYDIGFLFSKDDNKFETGCKNLLVLHPNIDPKIIEVLKNDRNRWISLMIEIRNNAINHAANKDPIVLKNLEQYMALESVDIIFDNCWRTMEDLLFIFAVDKMDPKFGMEMIELPEYHLNINHPERFGWHIVKYNN